METTHNLLNLVDSYYSAAEKLQRLKADKPTSEKEVAYWKRRVEIYIAAVKYWKKKVIEYGKGTIVEVSGEIEVSVAGLLSKKENFKIYLPNTDEATLKAWIKANPELKGIDLETIKLKEFQTGRLIIV